MAAASHIIVLAGPNGAGKSTAAPRVLAETLHVVEFVNADVIARGLSAFQPEAAALEAGRIMLSRLRQLAAQPCQLRVRDDTSKRSPSRNCGSAFVSNTNGNGEVDRIDRLFAEGTPIDEAVRAGVRRAMIRHKKLGNSVVSWRDGKVVWIPPEEIPIDDEPPKPS